MKQPLAIAVILPFGALALQWVLWPWIEPFVWFLFLPTVLLAARLAGYRGGLIATALSAPIAWYFFIPPRLSWQMEKPAHLGSVVLFVVVAYLICELQKRLEKEHAETVHALAEARAAEETLRKFSRVIEQTASTVIITDPEGVIEYVNPRFSAISGFSAQEAIGRRPNLIKSDLTPVQTYRELWATIRRGAVWHGELLNRRKDGSLYWESVIISPIRDDRGRITHFAGIEDDITERKQSEQALRESEERLTAIVGSAMDAVISVDEHQRIRLFNPAAAQMFGLDVAAAIGAPLARLIPPRFRRTYANSIRELERRETTARRFGTLGEIHGLRASGEEFPLEGSLSRTVVGGHKLYTVILRDLSERQRTELELRALRAEMEQMLTLHVASQTAAAIAHELNQPLNAITTYTEAAKRLLQAGNPRPERLLHALESSARQAQRAGAVMRELLGFLQKGETVSEAVDLNQAVRRALAIVESNGFGGFQSLVELAPELRPVWANRVQLEKVLVNLIANAVDAMRQAGIGNQRITVGVGTAATGNMAHVTVSDVGPGLDEQTARRVFEPFFSTKPKGLGLGLAISRSLIEAHGGRLWVESAPGAGATFHFTLPFTP